MACEPCWPVVLLPYVSSLPSGSNTVCTATTGQLYTGDHIPRVDASAGTGMFGKNPVGGVKAAARCWPLVLATDDSDEPESPLPPQEARKASKATATAMPLRRWMPFGDCLDPTELITVILKMWITKELVRPSAAQT